MAINLTAKVNIEMLKYMNADDIKEALPPLGLRIEFRQKLFNSTNIKPDVKAPLKFILS